jgi:predicted sulfurtransferase
MQFILTIMLTLTFGFSMLECQKVASEKSEVIKTNAATATPDAKTNSQVANAAPAATPAEEAPRISLADAKKDFDAKNALFIDTRGEASFKTEHIKGAINIPADAFQTRSAEVPKDKKIIAYCS